MKRVIHKETKKSVVISDAHADSLTGGRDPKYIEDLTFDWEKIQAENEAKKEAEHQARVAEEMKAAEEEAKKLEEVPVEEGKKAPAKKSATKK